MFASGEQGPQYCLGSSAGKSRCGQCSHSIHPDDIPRCSTEHTVTDPVERYLGPIISIVMIIKEVILRFPWNNGNWNERYMKTYDKVIGWGGKIEGGWRWKCRGVRKVQSWEAVHLLSEFQIWIDRILIMKCANVSWFGLKYPWITWVGGGWGRQLPPPLLTPHIPPRTSKWRWWHGGWVKVQA